MPHGPYNIERPHIPWQLTAQVLFMMAEVKIPAPPLNIVKTWAEKFTVLGL